MSFFKRMLQCACPTSVPIDAHVSAVSTLDLECRATRHFTPPIPFDVTIATVSLSVILALVAVMTLWWLMMVLLHLRSFGCSMLNPRRWFPDKSSGLERRVKALLIARKLERHRIGSRALSIVMPPFLLAYYGYVLFRVGVSPASQQRLLYSYMFENGGSIGILVSLWGLCTTSFPRCLTQLGADVSCCIFFLLCGLVSSFTQHDMNYIWLNSFVIQGQIMFTMFLASFWIVLIPNLINCFWHLLILFASDALEPNRGTLLISLLLQTAFIQLLGFVAEDWLQTEVVAKAREIEASKAVTTAQSLLSVLCDAVVPLGPDHTLQEPCPKLTTLLLRDPRSSARGQLFSEFLQRSDKERFQEFMADPAALPGKSRSLHVHLVDSVGTSVPVQLFHTSVQDQDGSVNHLIGITEDKDTDAFVPLRVPPANLPSLEPFVSTSDFSEESSGIPSERSSVSSHSSCSTLPVWESDQGTELLLKAAMSLELLWESKASVALFNFMGPSGSSFLSRFRDPAALWRWILRSQSSLDDVCSYGAVQIKDPQTGLSREAHLRVKFVHEDESLGMTFLFRPPPIVQRDRRQARGQSLRRTRARLSRREATPTRSEAL